MNPNPAASMPCWRAMPSVIWTPRNGSGWPNCCGGSRSCASGWMNSDHPGTASPGPARHRRASAAAAPAPAGERREAATRRHGPVPGLVCRRCWPTLIGIVCWVWACSCSRPASNWPSSSSGRNQRPAPTASRELPLPADGRHGRASGEVLVTGNPTHNLLMLDGLPPPPPNHTYRLWARVDGRLVGCVPFVPDGRGHVAMPIPTYSHQPGQQRRPSASNRSAASAPGRKGARCSAARSDPSSRPCLPAPPSPTPPRPAFPPLRRQQLDTLQVNLTYRCNQACVHCHVNAGPPAPKAWRQPPWR